MLTCRHQFFILSDFYSCKSKKPSALCAEGFTI